MDLIALGKKARQASSTLIEVSDATLNEVLLTSARLIRENKEFLKEQNAIDMENAVKSGKSASFQDRLLLSDKVIEGVAEGIEQVATLATPIDKVVYTYENKQQGISVEKRTVPFGVIGIIYEARPNVPPTARKPERSKRAAIYGTLLAAAKL